MGGDLGGLLSTALAIVSIATLAGLGLLRGTVTNLREQLRDEREARAADRAQKVDDEAEHVKERAEWTAKTATKDARIAELEADNAALGRVVTGEVHLVSLSQRLEDLIALVTALKEYVTRLLKD